MLNNNWEMKKDSLIRMKFEQSIYIAKVSAEKFDNAWLLFLLIIVILICYR